MAHCRERAISRKGHTRLTSNEIVPAGRSGGTNTSHTIVVPALQQLLAAVGRDADAADFERAVMVDNVLGKATDGSRRRTLRYLRELYLLRSDSILFRVLRDLWFDEQEGQPLLAGLCALARDASFRASATAIVETAPGDLLRSSDLAAAVDAAFPGAYNEATLAKIGRNTFSSWEQTGHLDPSDPPEKQRRRPTCTPSTVAFALMLGHLEGTSGAALFDTFWALVLNHPRSHLVDLAAAASQRGLIEFRHSGGVVDVGFAELLRPVEGKLL